MKSAAKYLILTLVALLTASCSSFFDDLSKCVTPKLHFVYYADGADNVLKDHIQSGRLYVYDESGKLHYIKPLGAAELRDGMDLKDIHSGKWTLVAWGNINSATDVKAPKSISAGSVTALPDKAGIYRTSDSLYYAEYVLDFSKLEGKDVEVPFSSAHVSLDVVVKGFDAVYPGQKLQLKAAPAGTHYSIAGYKGGIPMPTELKPYLPKLGHSVSDDMYRARFDLLRIDNEAGFTLSLLNADDAAAAPYVSLSLPDYVAEHKIPLKGRHEVEIPVLITFEKKGGTDQLVVNITPFVWGSINIKPDVIAQ